MSEQPQQLGSIVAALGFSSTGLPDFSWSKHTKLGKNMPNWEKYTK
jgi:hypothetical protein